MKDDAWIFDRPEGGGRRAVARSQRPLCRTACRACYGRRPSGSPSWPRTPRGGFQAVMDTIRKHAATRLARKNLKDGEAIDGLIRNPFVQDAGLRVSLPESTRSKRARD
jgi:hypothetical protein